MFLVVTLVRQKQIENFPLDQRHIWWLIYYWHTLYQLPGCRPGCLSHNMYSYCRWFWWMSGSFYSHPSHGQSESQGDTMLILHCLKPSGHYTSLSLHVTLSLVIAYFLNAMPMGWVMAWTTELAKYIHVHNTAKLLQMKEQALSLNIQMSTNMYGMPVWGRAAFWLDKRAWWVS